MTDCPVLTIANMSEWQRLSTVEVVAVKKGLRRVFPPLVFDVSGLDPLGTYSASMVLERVDDFKHKYIDDQWKRQADSDTPRPVAQKIAHPDGVQMGADWMNESIDFSCVRVTTGCCNDESTTFTVQTLHRYQPKLILTSSDGEELIVEHPIQQFIPVTKHTDRFKLLKSPVAEKKTSNKRAASEGAVEQPNAKRSPSNDFVDAVPYVVPCAQAIYQEPIQNNQYVYQQESNWYPVDNIDYQGEIDQHFHRPPYSPPLAQDDFVQYNGQLEMPNYNQYSYY